MGMMTAQSVAKKYQTTCPLEIAEYLDVCVCHNELPELVRGFYVRTQSNGIIVLNKLVDTARQRFFLAYGIGAHLKGCENQLFDYKHSSEVLHMPLIFAITLLELNGEYGNANIAEYYLEHGTPAELVYPLYEQIVHPESVG